MFSSGSHQMVQSQQSLPIFWGAPNMAYVNQAFKNDEITQRMTSVLASLDNRSDAIVNPEGAKILPSSWTVSKKPSYFR